ncbi:peptide-methionine (R)-S-oxide reductase MsrB [Parendozoicomonas haliclonae]|uniref:Peptide methionine sulfoxide reductase MsrB n=1 Tax=Parendozoicomonas haliclonae TaxID=1960125 RepID=A0A1X7AHR4_9GAMM|nr:peptide-methionine (R)-S-oxide reductase MsrB [Parendozoicomonas haliclonae]SMA43470.1 Peptide methionine sulfoxide reductase MsrB [Parendozoicomonas haliclonae]
MTERSSKMVRTDDEWRQKLTPEQYHVCREGGTERPFSGEYVDHKDAGLYGCTGCLRPLFRSDAKFDSGCGWPSYWQPVDDAAILYREDNSLGMSRTEILCAHCECHLGHVFPDGPPPTGLRYCVNSVSLNFAADPDTE